MYSTISVQTIPSSDAKLDAITGERSSKCDLICCTVYYRGCGSRKKSSRRCVKDYFGALWSCEPIDGYVGTPL